MKKSKILFFVTLTLTTPLLAACSASCDCPKCPGTAVISPSGQTTVVKPSGY